MTILDSLLAATGTPDPEQQMEEWSRQQSAKNRAAIDPNNPTGPPLSPATTTPPGQVPNNAKSDPDMGALIGSLARREQANQGFNQALGMGFGAFAQPRDRAAVDQMFNVAPLDATKLGASIMAANSNQQGQDRANAIGQLVNDPVKGPALAAQLHMDWGALKAGLITDPSMAGKIAQALGTPTPDLQNLTQLGQMGAVPGGKGMLGDVASGVVSKVAGTENAAMISAQEAWREKYGVRAPPWNPNDLASFKQWQANEAQKEDDRGKASAILGTADNTMRELQGHVANLQNNAGLMSILNGTQDIKAAARTAMEDPSGGWATAAKVAGVLKQPQIDAINELRLINSGQYASALQSMRGIASRPAASEVQGVADAMGQTKGIDMDANTYIKQAIEPLLTKIKYARANAWGASGTFHGMDSDLNPYVHANYLTKGDLFKEGSGAEDIEKTINKPLPADARAEAIERMKSDYSEKERSIDALRQQGFDVSELERLTPDKLRKM